MLEIPRRKLVGMTMAVFGFFTTLSYFDQHPSGADPESISNTCNKLQKDNAGAG
jgi:hypothetical protein